MLQYHMPGTEPPKRPEDAPHFFVYGLEALSQGSRMCDPSREYRSDTFFETRSQAEAAKAADSRNNWHIIKLKVYRA